jgi:hypothetical protein
MDKEYYVPNLAFSIGNASKARMQLSTQNLIGPCYFMDCFYISLLILYSHYVYLFLGAFILIFIISCYMLFFKYLSDIPTLYNKIIYY